MLDLRPVFNFRSAQLPHNFHNLSDFRLSLKKHASLNKFIKDVAQGPNIDSEVIVGGSKKKFRSSVPQCLDFFRHGIKFLSNYPAQPEIRDFDVHVLVYQNILGFEVSVKNFVLVHIAHPQQNLFHDFLICQIITFATLWSTLLFFLINFARSSSMNSK